MELQYHDDSLVITAELPGLYAEEIKAEIVGNVLILEGERRRDDGGGRKVWHTERSYGYFYREIVLPDAADTEHARAEFHNGILRVTIPLADARRRALPIQNVRQSPAGLVRGEQAG
jgi:HSP20 family protein